MAANFGWGDNEDWFNDHPGNTGGGGNYVEPDAPVDPPDSGDPFGVNRIVSMIPKTGSASGGGGGGNSGYSDHRPGLPDLSNFRSPDPLQPWTETFTLPTIEEASQEPGFQFSLGEGLKAIEHSAAAKGTLLTGGSLKGEQKYAIDSANTNYGKVADRAYNLYEGRRQNFLTNEANRYNSQRSNLNDQWGINSDYFNMGRANRLDDYNIWSGSDMNSFNKLLEWAKLTKPPSPYVPS